MQAAEMENLLVGIGGTVLFRTRIPTVASRSTYLTCEWRRAYSCSPYTDRGACVEPARNFGNFNKFTHLHVASHSSVPSLGW